jgi:hypothetical protein
MSELLQTIFELKPADEYVLVWQSKLKTSYWFQDPEEITPRLNPGLYNKGDVYFGLGTSKVDHGKFNRCKAEEISGIGAFWLDIDVKGEAHKKGKLPESYDQAHQLLLTAYPEPSCIIDSGHGLQAYWFLDTWYTITDENRSFIQNLLLEFNAHWRLTCAANGFDADSVCDLARVMRLPESMNCKILSNKVQVKEWQQIIPSSHSIAQISTWWDSAQLKQKVLELEKKPRAASKNDIDTIQSPAPDNLEETIQLNMEKWDILKSIDKRVELTWKGEREDLADQSASSYTMALGRLALNYGWSDEDTTALLVAFRKFHHWEVKPHAIKLTIQKIHDTPSGFADSDSQDPEEKKPISLEAISNTIGIQIKELIRFDTTPPAYILVTQDDKRINLGGIEGITDFKRFRNIVASATGILATKFKPDAWDRVAQGLLGFLIHDSAGSEATEEGQLIEWIQVYLNSVTVHEDAETGIAAGEPWIEEGHAHIIGTALRGWIAVNLQDRIDSKKLGLTLRSLKSVPLSIKSRSVWRLQKEVWSK